jgi:hypothetical protein
MNKINLQNVQFFMPNNFRRYPLKQEQFKDFQAPRYKLKEFQGLGFFFPNSRAFKHFQILYEPWFIRGRNLCYYVYNNMPDEAEYGVHCQTLLISYEFLFP